MTTKRKIEVGAVYSAKCGGKYHPVKITKNLGHGRYTATTMHGGQEVRVASEAVKGSGETVEQWEARQRPQEQAAPATAPAASASPRPGKTKKKIVTLAEYEAGAKGDADLDAVVTAAAAGNLATGISIPMPGAKKPRKPGDAPRRTSGLDAAVMVLREAGTPMRCGEMVTRMLERKWWQTNGKTPASTIYALILLEIQKRGSASRFRKTDRGMFALTEAAVAGEEGK